LLAPYLASTSRIAPRCSRSRSSIRMLYVLATPHVPRLVSDPPSGLVETLTGHHRRGRPPPRGRPAGLLHSGPLGPR
jgi:hypothetical protein